MHNRFSLGDTEETTQQKETLEPIRIKIPMSSRDQNCILSLFVVDSFFYIDKFPVSVVMEIAFYVWRIAE